MSSSAVNLIKTCQRWGVPVRLWYRANVQQSALPTGQQLTSDLWPHSSRLHAGCGEAQVQAARMTPSGQSPFGFLEITDTFSIFNSTGGDYFWMFETLIEYRGSFCHYLRDMCCRFDPSRHVTVVCLFVLFSDDDVVPASAFIDL